MNQVTQKVKNLDATGKHLVGLWIMVLGVAPGSLAAMMYILSPEIKMMIHGELRQPANTQYIQCLINTSASKAEYDVAEDRIVQLKAIPSAMRTESQRNEIDRLERRQAKLLTTVGDSWDEPCTDK